MPTAKKIAVAAKTCVACGCCVKVCPKNAMAIYKGLRAVADRSLCVGCGKCAKVCPAGVIEMADRNDGKGRAGA